jgi:hypothetical protein
VHHFQNRIHYLGHIISAERIIIYPEKIEAIRGCPAPRNVIEVRSCMGLVVYYRRFIKVFSNIESPVTYLQKKGVKFERTPKCEEFFQWLKDILTF